MSPPLSSLSLARNDIVTTPYYIELLTPNALQTPFSSRLFAKNGYAVALVARGVDSLEKLSAEINAQSQGQAAPFPLTSYSHTDIATTWDAIHKRFPKPEYEIRVAVWNAGQAVWKPFLEITPEEVQSVLDTGVAAAFAFARHSILAFKDNEIDPSNGKRGTLIFTGATASIRGNVVTSAFSAAKHGARALSQSLAKEFGKQNIHVAHVRYLAFWLLYLLKDTPGHYRWSHPDRPKQSKEERSRVGERW